MAGEDRAARLATAVLEFRRARSEKLPAELFSEPAWELLLELFVADARGVRLTARQVSERCNTPPSVLSRWLVYLSKSGLVVGDGNGDLDDELTLSGRAMASVEHLLSHAVRLQAQLIDSGIGDDPRKIGRNDQ